MALRSATRPGFLAGAATGALVAVAASWLRDAGGGDLLPAIAGSTAASEWRMWVGLNLGHSLWAFAAVVVLWSANTAQLARLLARPAPSVRGVVRLDQLTEVWIAVFIGIGVIWTAVGMRDALQAALAGDGLGGGATPASMLARLVDGGILLALTTTIVGGVGGYVMRLVKTLWIGPRLQDFYDRQRGRDLDPLLTVLERIEARLPGTGSGSETSPSTSSGTPERGRSGDAAMG